MKTKEKTSKKFNFWPYFGKHKGAISMYILLYVIQLGMQLFASIYIAEILVKITEGVYFLAIKMFALYTVLGVLDRVLNFIRHYVYNKTSLKVINAMAVDVAVQAFNISDAAYSTHGTASFTRRIANDPDVIFSNLTFIVDSISEITSSLFMIIYISVINVYVGIIALAGIVILSVLEFVRHRVVKQRRKVLYKKGEEVSSLLTEVVKSEKDIKSLNLEQKLKEDLIVKNDDYAKLNVKTTVVARSFWDVRFIIIQLLTLSIVALSLVFMDKGLMTLAGFMIVWSNKGRINVLSSMFGSIVDYFTNVKLATERINELYEDEEYEIEKFGKRNLKNVKGRITFDKVGFSYTEYKDKTPEEIKQEIKHNKKHKVKEKVKPRVAVGKNKVLENLSFEVEPNTTVAFVGKSGSGKTTILNLMAKMIEANKGRVCIDGVNIKSLSKETIRTSISLVNQFPYIFDMTIRENLILAKPDATEEEIQQAVKASALSEFIDQLPEKLETRVGESGIKLSGGQRQRVAIARAMLRKTPIIIFDESTSSLDNLSQNMVKQSIENIKGKTTVVIVAHRLSTIKNADVIFFLDGGKIVDQGTFEELYKRNKAFKTMFLAENI